MTSPTIDRELVATYVRRELETLCPMKNDLLKSLTGRAKAAERNFAEIDQ